MISVLESLRQETLIKISCWAEIASWPFFFGFLTSSREYVAPLAHRKFYSRRMDSNHSAGYTPYINLRQTLLERGGIEPHPSVIPPMLPVTTLSPSSFIRSAGTGLSKRTPVESSTAARVTLQPWRLPASCRSELLEDNSTSARLYLSILCRRTYELGLRYRSYSPDPIRRDGSPGWFRPTQLCPLSCCLYPASKRAKTRCPDVCAVLRCFAPTFWIRPKGQAAVLFHLFLLPWRLVEPSRTCAGKSAVLF